MHGMRNAGCACCARARHAALPSQRGNASIRHKPHKRRRAVLGAGDGTPVICVRRWRMRRHALWRLSSEGSLPATNHRPGQRKLRKQHRLPHTRGAYASGPASREAPLSACCGAREESLQASARRLLKVSVGPRAFNLCEGLRVAAPPRGKRA